MCKIFKKIAAITMAAAMAMSMAVSASADCSHYNQRISCGTYVGEQHGQHGYYEKVNGINTLKYCTQKTIMRRHSMVCTACGSTLSTDGGSACYMTHSSCGAAAVHYH